MTRADYLLLLTLGLLQFCHIVDFMIVMPLGEKLMADFAIGPREFSWLVSAYAGAAFVASLASAAFVDRFDRRRVLLLAHVGFTVGTLGCAVFPGFAGLLVARAVAGAFGGMVATQVLAIVGDYFGLERRGRAMGIIMMAFSAASVLGVPAGISLASFGGWRLPFYTVAGLAVLAGAAAVAMVPTMTAHLASGERKPGLGELFAGVARDGNQVLALAFTVVLMLGHFTVIPFIAPFMQINLGFSDGELSLIYLIGGLLTVVSLPLIGRWADASGPARVFTFGSLGTVAAILLTTHLPVGIATAAALAVTSLFFVTSGGRTIPALTLVTSVVHAERRGGFMSLRAAFNQLGMGAASFVAGLVIVEGAGGELLHYGTVGWIATGMSALAVWLAWRLRAVA